MSQTAFRGEFAEHGFWQKTEGMLVIESPEGEIAGHIEFFRPVSYWDAFELSYQLYSDEYAGRGFVTEAVQLLVDYLSARRRSTEFTWSLSVRTPAHGVLPRSADSCSKEPFGARSSTTAAIRTCCSTRSCGLTRGLGAGKSAVNDRDPTDGTIALSAQAPGRFFRAPSDDPEPLAEWRSRGQGSPAAISSPAARPILGPGSRSCIGGPTCAAARVQPSNPSTSQRAPQRARHRPAGCGGLAR